MKIATLFTIPMLMEALRDAMLMLDPRHVAKNPVMFCTEVGAVLVSILWIADLVHHLPAAYDGAVATILWITVLLANVGETLAESRGRAQAKSLRATRQSSQAHKIVDDGSQQVVQAHELRQGDLVRIDKGELIPADGEIVEGMAMVDESAITGESAPVLREAGGDRSGVTGGTKVLSDSIVVRVSCDPGASFLDRMIALVEGAVRQKTPNELAMTATLASLTLGFLLVVATLPFLASYFKESLSIATLCALFVCLIPTTIGGLLPAIGIAGMNRVLKANIIAKSGKAVEIAGDIDTLLVDKTGTITVGDRQATGFFLAPGAKLDELIEAAYLSSLKDETPEGKSIAAFARIKARLPLPEVLPAGTQIVAYSAQTRKSGVELADGRAIFKGAPDTVLRRSREASIPIPSGLEALVQSISINGGTPLLVSLNDRILGAIALSDVLKAGIAERMRYLREAGLRIVMITGDNPLTAAAIAGQAGVDHYIAEATPEDKLRYIQQEQAQGRLVAMMGDGTNDAPALAQADLGIAMNSGTQAAKEAANMVDLDNDPSKLIAVVEVGKQLLLTRGAVTTFSLANDIGKYFAILPAMFAALVPGIGVLNVLGLQSPHSAVLSALMFNAISIPLLLPLSLRGVRYRVSNASSLLLRNALVYGLGGLLLPFVGIKLIDMGLEVICW